MDSTKYFEAASALDRFGTQLRAVTDLANVLRDAGSIQQAAQEAQERHRVASTQEAMCRERATQLQVDIEAAERRLVEAQELAVRVPAEAQAKAQELLDAAAAEAKDLVDEAHQRAEAVETETKTKLDYQVAAAKAKVDDLDKISAGLEKEIESAKAELDDINKKIAQAREAARALFQGD